MVAVQTFRSVKLPICIFLKVFNVFPSQTKMGRNTLYKWRMKATKITTSRTECSYQTQIFAIEKSPICPVKIFELYLSKLNTKRRPLAKTMPNCAFEWQGVVHELNGRQRNPQQCNEGLEHLGWAVCCLHQSLYMSLHCLNTGWRRVWSTPHHPCNLSQKWGVIEKLWILLPWEEKEANVWPFVQ